MKPYYEKDGITVFHGDCLEVLPTLPSDLIDVTLTDPPYNVGIVYGKAVDDSKPDYQGWCGRWLGECVRLSEVVALTPGIVNVGTFYGIRPPDWLLCWHKPACMGRSPIGFNNWEPVLLWGKPGGRSGADVVTAPIVPDGEVEGHPCPKPLRWAQGLLRLLSRGGKVLDPFLGSGTVLRAAKDAGLEAIGVEVEERFCEMAVRRLEQASLFASLKEPEPTQTSLLDPRD